MSKKLQTRKEFAEMLGVKPSYLGPNVQRGKIVLTKSGLINTQNEINQAFIQNYKKTQAIKAGKYEDVDVDNSEDSQSSGDGIPALVASERKLKYLDTLKREKEVELLEFKKQKLEGEVIPYELVPPIMLQMNQSMMIELKNGMEEVLRQIAKENGLSVASLANMRKKVSEGINTSARKAIDTAQKGVQAIADNYTETRGRGERK